MGELGNWGRHTRKMKGLGRGTATMHGAVWGETARTIKSWRGGDEDQTLHEGPGPKEDWSEIWGW